MLSKVNLLFWQKCNADYSNNTLKKILSFKNHCNVIFLTSHKHWPTECLLKPEESLYIKRNPLFRDRGLFLEKHREGVSSRMEKAMFSVNRFLLSPLLFMFE